MSSSVFPVPLSGIQESIIAAKADLIVGTANDAPGILSVGTDTHVLTADSAEATGLKWAAPTAVGNFTHIRASNSTTNFPSSTATKVLWTTEDYDTLGEFASSRFTATNDGYYLVNAGVGTDPQSLGANTLFDTRIYKNGSMVFRGAVYAVFSITGRLSARISAVVEMAVDDYIEIYFQQNATANTTGAADGPQTFLTIDRIVS